MSKIFAPIMVLFLAFCSHTISAADVPSVDEGAQDLSKVTCIDQTTQNCINTICLTSEETDCQDNCVKMAQDKCQQQSDE